MIHANAVSAIISYIFPFSISNHADTVTSFNTSACHTLVTKKPQIIHQEIISTGQQTGAQFITGPAKQTIYLPQKLHQHIVMCVVVSMNLWLDQSISKPEEQSTSKACIEVVKGLASEILIQRPQQTFVVDTSDYNSQEY